MRLATVRVDGTTRAARVDDNEAVLLIAPDVGALLASEDWRRVASRAGPAIAIEGLDYAPLVPRPAKIICVGINYASHAAEVGRPLPEHPSLFAKFALTLVGACDPIVLPPVSVSTQVDWEVELAVVVGTAVRRATSAKAAQAIAGSTIFNDISMRDWQTRTPQVLAGKNFERSSPLGPVLVTTDEVEPDDLAITCEVDGEMVQQGRTSDMVFTPADLVAHISTFITLEPGDVISTGTPAGVGAARTPPRFLGDGQTLRSSIEGIGELVNPCQATRSSSDPFEVRR